MNYSLFMEMFLPFRWTSASGKIACLHSWAFVEREYREWWKKLSELEGWGSWKLSAILWVFAGETKSRILLACLLSKLEPTRPTGEPGKGQILLIEPRKILNSHHDCHTTPVSTISHASRFDLNFKTELSFFSPPTFMLQEKYSSNYLVKPQGDLNSRRVFVFYPREKSWEWATKFITFSLTTWHPARAKVSWEWHW